MSLEFVQKRFKQKGQNEKLSKQQLKNLLKNFKQISQTDLTYLIEKQLSQSQQNQFTFQEVVSIFKRFNNDTKKISDQQVPINKFLYESLVTYKNQKISFQNLINISTVDNSFNFDKILGQSYQKKLTNIGPLGIINEKQQPFVEKYTFYHWVQSSPNHLIQDYAQNSQFFFRSIYQFNFERSLEIIDALSDQNQQINIFYPIINNLVTINQEIKKQDFLKNLFYQRNQFQIQVKFQDQDVFKKGTFFSQNQILGKKVNQLKSTLNYCADYCRGILDQLQNPYFQAAAIFLANDKDKKEDQYQQICFFEGITISDRFQFAQRFLNPKKFQQFKLKIRQKIENSSLLENILIFGKSKQSQIILQNYLNQTNDLQRVAIISIYLKYSPGKQSKASLYDRFIKCFQELILLKSDQKDKLIFDKKRLEIQGKKKVKTPYKTFSFDCSNCKENQTTALLLDKIKVDVLKQPRFKGHQHFSKQFKEQIMNCIVCLQVLPRCCVCLFPITVFNAYAQFAMRKKKCDDQKKDIKYVNKGQNLQDAVVWCPKCFHGGHYNHIKEWHQKYQKTCPVADCKCKCSF